jgi:diadenosine tetraphosphate (Ap4A) HIT family hydrolase
MTTDICPFCGIARGADPSVEVVCQSDSWVAFFPDDPATPGHTLIIPRHHVPHLWQADGALAADLMAAVMRVGNAIYAALSPDGMNLITSAGDAAEQTVPHLHLHVVPRWTGDPIGPIWPPKERMADRLREELAAAIRDLCADG